MSLSIAQTKDNEGLSTNANGGVQVNGVATTMTASALTKGNTVLAVYTLSVDAQNGLPHTDLGGADNLGNTYTGPYNEVSTPNLGSGGTAQTQAYIIGQNLATGGTSGNKGTVNTYLNAAGGGDTEDWQANFIVEIGGVPAGSLIATNGAVHNSVAANALFGGGAVTIGANQVPAYIFATGQNTGAPSGQSPTPTPIAQALAGATLVFSAAHWNWGMGPGYEEAVTACWLVTTAGTYTPQFKNNPTTTTECLCNVAAFMQTGPSGAVLAAAAADTTAATANITAQALLLSAAQSATAAAATLVNYASVTLAAPLYVGPGSLLDPNAVWTNGAPTVGSVVYYDPSAMTVASDGTLAGYTQSFTTLVQFNNAGTWSDLYITFTGSMVGYAGDTTRATGALAATLLSGNASDTTTAAGLITVAGYLSANAVSLTTAVGKLTAQVALASQSVDFTQASGLLKVAAALSAAATDVTSATGSFVTAASLSAHALDSTVAIGGLSTNQIVGAAIDTTTASGLITVTSNLAGAAQSLSSATAALTVQVALAAQALDFTGASGQITVLQPITGQATDTTVATGFLSVAGMLAAAAQDVTIATANLQTQSLFLGAAVSTTTATGTLQALSQFGSANLVAVSLTGLQGAQSAYPQGTSSIVTAEYLDIHGVPFAPQNVQYRIDDLVSGANIVPWTPVTPLGTTNAIVITQAQNAMVSLTLESETHQLLMQIEDGYGTPYYADVQFDIVRVIGTSI